MKSSLYKVILIFRLVTCGGNTRQGKVALCEELALNPSLPNCWLQTLEFHVTYVAISASGFAIWQETLEACKWSFVRVMWLSCGKKLVMLVHIFSSSSFTLIFPQWYLIACNYIQTVQMMEVWSMLIITYNVSYAWNFSPHASPTSLNHTIFYLWANPWEHRSQYI